MTASKDLVVGSQALPVSNQQFALLVSLDRGARDVMRTACHQAGYQSLDCPNFSDAVAMAGEVGVTVCCIAASATNPGLCQLIKDLREALIDGAPILMMSSMSDVPLQVESLFLCGVTEVFTPTSPEILTHYLVNRDTERVGPHGQHIYGKQVLLVEDSTTVAFVVRKTLLEHGLMVDWERSAEHGLESLAHKKYDLLITDLVLEGEMSGVALVSHLRQSGYTEYALPILAMTGFDERSRRRELFRLGVNDYVVKPVLEEELIVRTRNLIIANRLAIRVEAQHARIKMLESSDALTGVYNRRMLFNMSEKYVATARRTQGVFSLVLMELLGVGDVSAQYGTDAGDEVLSDCARAMRLVARSSDVVARVGDARFAVALPYCAAVDAPGVGGRYHRVLSGQRPFGMPLEVSVVTVSLDAGLDSDFEHLFARALRALESTSAPVPA
ncbi:MAG: response regulator [Halothiobacillaceae bacterium]|nr:response regulator [Halothiobacillaceae bacterium]